MKPFDIEKAKAGAKVCTRDGREVRIVCWDMKNSCPIIGLITHKDGREYYQVYNEKGLSIDGTCDSDLMMATEKHEGWINLYHPEDCSLSAGNVHDTYEKARENASHDLVATIKIEWEE